MLKPDFQKVTFLLYMGTPTDLQVPGMSQFCFPNPKAFRPYRYSTGREHTKQQLCASHAVATR